MFTGIVEEVGTILGVPAAGHAGKLDIRASVVLGDVRLGDSIAVNGVCLTVTSFSADRFAVDVMPETLMRSNLGCLRPGSRVNLERAMQMGGRFGGHIVSGHIDGVGRVASTRKDQNAVRIRVACPEHIRELVVEKGSICVDGISLTVSGLFPDGFEVSVIPHTREQTTLLGRGVGDEVNLESDIVGKYVRRLVSGATGAGDSMGPGDATSSGHAVLTMDYLRERGF